MKRIKNEEKFLLKNSFFELEATNRGALLRYIKAKGEFITTELKDEVTKPGSKGAFFIAPIVFGRILDRTLVYKNISYQMPYPEDINSDEIDPQKIYIHGIHHYYTWDVLSNSNSHLSFILKKERLEKSYPFPHTTIITYELNENELHISATIKDTEVETPCMLTMHPFFKFYIDQDKDQDKKTPPKFKANLLKKFEYDINSKFPLNYESPIDIINPFKTLTELPKDLDHSFLAESESEILWPNGINIKISDLTEKNVTPYNPLQIWTTGADSRNAFGIENGGPANLFWLVENKKVDKSLLIKVQPGEEKSRRIRIKIS